MVDLNKYMKKQDPLVADGLHAMHYMHGRDPLEIERAEQEAYGHAEHHWSAMDAVTRYIKVKNPKREDLDRKECQRYLIGIVRSIAKEPAPKRIPVYLEEPHWLSDSEHERYQAVARAINKMKFERWARHTVDTPGFLKKFYIEANNLFLCRRRVFDLILEAAHSRWQEEIFKEIMSRKPPIVIGLWYGRKHKTQD